MNVQKKIFKGTLSLFLSFMLIFTALFSTSFANSSLNSPTNQKAIATSTKSGNYIYCCSGTCVYKVNIKTKKKIRLYKSKFSWASIYSVSVYKGYVYFVAAKGGIDLPFPYYIYRIKTNGTSLKYLGEGWNPIVYNNKIYYEKTTKSNIDMYKSQGIYKMNLNGNNKTCIISSSNIVDFKVYKSHIYYVYYTDSSHSYIYRISTSGKNDTQLIRATHSDSQYSINCCYVYHGYLYFTSNGGFYKYNIYSGKLTKFRNSTGYIVGVDNGYLYYIYSNHIYKLGLSSNKRYTIVSGKSISDCSVSSGYITYCYYSRSASGNIYYLIKANRTNKVYLGKSFIQ